MFDHFDRFSSFLTDLVILSAFGRFSISLGQFDNLDRLDSFGRFVQCCTVAFFFFFRIFPSRPSNGEIRMFRFLISAKITLWKTCVQETMLCTFQFFCESYIEADTSYSKYSRRDFFYAWAIWTTLIEGYKYAEN